MKFAKAKQPKENRVERRKTTDVRYDTTMHWRTYLAEVFLGEVVISRDTLANRVVSVAAHGRLERVACLIVNALHRHRGAVLLQRGYELVHQRSHLAVAGDLGEHELPAAGAEGACASRHAVARAC